MEVKIIHINWIFLGVQRGVTEALRQMHCANSNASNYTSEATTVRRAVAINANNKMAVTVKNPRQRAAMIGQPAIHGELNFKKKFIYVYVYEVFCSSTFGKFCVETPNDVQKQAELNARLAELGMSKFT